MYEMQLTYAIKAKLYRKPVTESESETLREQLVHQKNLLLLDHF